MVETISAEYRSIDQGGTPLLIARKEGIYRHKKKQNSLNSFIQSTVLFHFTPNIN